jgi:hypothetical protein
MMKAGRAGLSVPSHDAYSLQEPASFSGIGGFISLFQSGMAAMKNLLVSLILRRSILVETGQQMHQRTD